MKLFVIKMSARIRQSMIYGHRLSRRIEMHVKYIVPAEFNNL